MSDIRDRLGVFDDLEVPDLWNEARWREPSQPVHNEPSPARRAAIAILALAVAATGFAFAVRAYHRGTVPGATPSPSGTLKAIATIPIAHSGMSASDVEVGGGFVWLTLSRWTDQVMQGAVVRVDPVTNSIAAEIAVNDGVPTALAVTPDRVWVLVQASAIHTELRAIDPNTNSFVSTVDLPSPYVGPITATDDAAWLAVVEIPPGGDWKDATRSILRVDAASGETLSLPADVCQVNDSNCTPTRAVVADGSVWFEGQGRNHLFRVDPATNDVTAIPTNAWCGFAVGEGSVWVGVRQPDIPPDQYSNAPYLALRVDETSGNPVGDPVLVEGGLPDAITGSACPVAVGDGGVWVEGYDRELNHVLVGRVAFGTLGVDVAKVVAEGDAAPRVAFDFVAGTMWANDGQSLTRYELP